MGSEMCIRDRFGGIIKNTIAESDGAFVITLKSQSASKKPRTIYIKSGNDQIEIKNVVVGEVWLCSGQSNMEWKVNQSANYEVEKKSANYPLIRMITVKHKFLTEPQFNFEGNWRSTTPESV